MSHMARGILVELLSRPDGWDTTADDMWRESVKKRGKDSPGRRQFRAAFAELKAHGYMAAESAQLDHGQVGTLLTVRDIPLPVADVPACGTSARPAVMGEGTDGADVPASGTSARPGQTGVSAGGTDVPHAGTSYRKRSVENGESKKTGQSVADAVGNSAGGFGRAGASAGAGSESGQAEGGSAASGQTTPARTTTTTSSPRPRTVKTQPRQELPGWQLVRDAIPTEVARPGTRLYPGLHRAINDLLTGNPAAGIPSRTPEQVLARLNRRWYGENAEERSAADYRGCDRCTASGCPASRRMETNPDGCDRIKNRSSWLAAALLAQDCPDPGCEDGQIIGGGACRACAARHEERRTASTAASEAAARWDAESQERAATTAVVDAWTRREQAEEQRYRETLAEAGVYGVLLDHRVAQHMAGWRDRNPRPQPKVPPQRPQVPVQGAFLISVPGTSVDSATGQQAPVQRRRRTVVCTVCDKGHRTTADHDLCPNCREEATA